MAPSPKTPLRMDFPLIQTRLLPSELAELSNVIAQAPTYSMGPQLKQLEDDFATWLNRRHALGLNNCTAALELAAMVSGVGPGDEVIVPAHTFTATALPFLRAGATLVFADIDPATFVVSAASIRACLTPRTRVIVPVHLYGLMAPMDEIMAIATERNLTVIEDVAQAPGAAMHGRLAGSFGHFACFSFHSQKNIHALGEGGMLVTDDSDAYEKCLGLRKIGSRPYKNQEKYWHPAMSNIVEAMPGKLPYNFALAEPNAAVARMLRSRIDQINEGRQSQATFLRQSLANHPELEFQQVPPGYTHAYHLLVARCQPGPTFRDALIDLLFEEFRIKCVVQYYPLYNYELFQRHGYTPTTSACPESDVFFASMISFPFSSDMPDDDLRYLGNAIHGALQQL